MAKYALNFVALDRIDWQEYERLWQKSLWQPANCWRPMIELYVGYYRKMFPAGVGILTAHSGGELVGAFPAAVASAPHSNFTFWVNDSLMTFPRYGVLGTEPGLPWLAELDCMLDEWADDEGAASVWHLAQNRSADCENMIVGGQYILRTAGWAEAKPKPKVVSALDKARKLISDKGGSLLVVNPTTTDELDQWRASALATYNERWSQEKYNRDEIKLLLDIYVQAALRGLGFATQLSLSVEGQTYLSFEFGFYQRERHLYLADFVATSSCPPAFQLGNLTTSCVLDLLNANLGACYYDFGPYDMPYKKAFGSTLMVLRKFIGYNPKAKQLADQQTTLFSEDGIVRERADVHTEYGSIKDLADAGLSSAPRATDLPPIVLHRR